MDENEIDLGHGIIERQGGEDNGQTGLAAEPVIYMVRYTPEPSEWDEAPEEVVDFTPHASLAYSSWNFEAEVTPLSTLSAVVEEAVKGERDSCLQAVLGEQLIGDTDDDADRAYMRAIDDAADAIRARSIP